MLKYVGKRLLWMIPIAVGVSLIVFFLIGMVPGDPGSIILGAGADQAQIDAMNTALGYYDPFWVRYFNYMKGIVLHFDFGTSYVTSLPVLEELKSKVVISIIIAFSAITGSLAIGVPLGVLSAVKQYSLFDVIPTSLAMIFAAAPSFWVGLMLMLEFSLKRSIFPSFGVEGVWFVLPMLTLASTYGAAMLRFTRSSMLETIRQDYIRTARAKGAAERVVIWRHALKNALLPVITSAGNTFGALLGGAIVTETLFSLPGLGTFIVNGIKQKDIPVVMGGTITLSVLFSFVMLTVDLIYAFVDPRVKAKYSGKRG